MTRSDAAEGGRDVGAARPTHSVVVPVYRNLATLPALLERLGALSPTVVGSMEAVFVIDASPDDKPCPVAPPSVERGTVTRPSSSITARNFGSFAAIRPASPVRVEYFAMMAADLQEPPELLMEFFATLGQAMARSWWVCTARVTPRPPPWRQIPFWRAYRRFVPAVDSCGRCGCVRVHPAVRDPSCRSRRANVIVGRTGLLARLSPRVRCPICGRRAVDGRSGWTLAARLRTSPTACSRSPTSRSARPYRRSGRLRWFGRRDLGDRPS